MSHSVQSTENIVWCAWLYNDSYLKPAYFFLYSCSNFNNRFIIYIQYLQYFNVLKYITSCMFYINWAVLKKLVKHFISELFVIVNISFLETSLVYSPISQSLHSNCSTRYKTLFHCDILSLSWWPWFNYYTNCPMCRKFKMCNYLSLLVSREF
jgi:hypothetical protein